MPIGKLEPFELNSKQWPAYIRRVRQFIKLNEIKDELQVAMLITVVGEATYSLMCDLCSPNNPEDKEFDDLIKLVTDHLEPKRSDIAERHVFRLRRQHAGEPLMEYLQQLKHLASTCNFGETLEVNLRDQFVSGLSSEAMRSRIFAEREIKYKEAVELALALEAAERHAEVSAGTSGLAPGAGAAGVAESLHHNRAGHGSRGRDKPAPREDAGRAQSQAQGSKCWRCGKPHKADRCRYSNYNCDLCHERGHLKVMCKKVNKGFNVRQNYVSESESELDFFNIDVATQGNKPYIIKVLVDNQELACELDTGSRISAINNEVYEDVFKNKIIYSDNLVLRCYSGLRIESLGYILVDVKLGNIYATQMRLYVIKNGSRPLLGRDWMRALKINQINLHNINLDKDFVNRLCVEFPEVFCDKLGTCKQAIKLQLTSDKPVYVRARNVPIALKSRVENELARLEQDGTIYRIDNSDYGTPIVPVIKESGEVRICGDYKITINPILKRDYYPLPRIDELFANLSCGDKYSKIDLKHAYEQCYLADDFSQKIAAITTHVGTFAYRRTPYGLNCIPEKFQKIMEETLRGVQGTVVFLDDICVTGADDKMHLSNLRAVLSRLRDMGLTVKLSKCKFLQKSVKYLGFIIDRTGLHPDPDKLDAITNAPRPEDVTKLKSFLGMLNYYGKFIPNLSMFLHPLHKLLGKDVIWQWDSKCEAAFNEAKRALLGDRVLAHYEEGRPLVLAVDSSAYGLGAVLAHRYPGGDERPVSYVSRSLNDAEKNYSQLDKEALAIYFGITKHHQYLFGRQFLLRTDHQPLSYIFGKSGGIPQTAASRLQRWAARLAAYDFSVEFVKSSENGPADALSRLPLARVGHQRDNIVNYINLIEDSVPISFKEIAHETKKDLLLTKIYGYVLFGWPPKASCEEEKPYFFRKQELSIDLGCILYNYRVVVPLKLQSAVLKEIHLGHLGMNKMKNIARSYIYWPNLDRDIEQEARACSSCRAVLDAPPRAALHPWEFPLHPWQRVHADFADCGGKRYLIMVDANTKWIEVVAMASTEAKSTIKVFRLIFARFGLPAQLVTDNGPPFLSLDFKTYCLNNCIKHVTSAPYRPQGNGAAENAVKTVKKAIKRAIYEGDDVTTALSQFLFQYRNSEHASTGVSPARAMLGRRLRGRLDALRPSVAAVVDAAQSKQIEAAGGRDRTLEVGDKVLARDYSVGGGRWAEGQIAAKTGPVSYEIDMDRGLKYRRHVDQIWPIKSTGNRYSLTRTVASSEEPHEAMSEDSVPRVSRGSLPPPSPATSVGADEVFEDAREDAGEGTRAESSARPEQPPLLPPPAPDASSRAIRHYNREVKKNK